MGRQVFARVMPIIAEDVADRVGNLAPRLERAGVIAIGKDGAFAARQGIEPLATRMARPCMPRESDSALSTSTNRCR